MKTCSKCLATKDFGEFYSDKAKSDNLRGYCKSCDNKSRFQRLPVAKKPNKTSTFRDGVLVGRICSSCKKDLPINEYYSEKNYHCKECCKQYARTSRHKVYGLSSIQFEEMKEAQDNRCAICGVSPQTRVLCIDHNHQTGMVRGLLCAPCNSALGLLKEDIALMTRAIDYLIGTSTPHAKLEGQINE